MVTNFVGGIGAAGGEMSWNWAKETDGAVEPLFDSVHHVHSVCNQDVEFLPRQQGWVLDVEGVGALVLLVSRFTQNLVPQEAKVQHIICGGFFEGGKVGFKILFEYKF